MKVSYRVFDIILGICAAALIGLLVWQHSISVTLAENVKAQKEELKRAKSQLKHLEKLKDSQELSALEEDIFLCVPVGDLKALGFAKELKQKVRSLGLDNFVFVLGDGRAPAGAAVKPVSKQLEILPVTVTVTFESQYPQIVSFLKYLYELKRFVNIERLTIARIENSSRAIPSAGAGLGSLAAGIPGMPSGMALQAGSPVSAQGREVKNIYQKATVVLTAYTFTQ